MKLRRTTVEQLKTSIQKDTELDARTLGEAQSIIDRVRIGGDEAIIELSKSFGEIEDQPLLVTVEEIDNSFDSIDANVRETLERTAERIASFAKKQLESLHSLSTSVDGGRAGHTIVPIENVGCYVPGGRYPLVSTALMTVVTAKVAGCNHVIMATPNPNAVMLAAAKIAGADSVMRIGGAQAIAAMAYGTDSINHVDLIVGPGNRWVTAAKKWVSGKVAIDMLAGPTELVVLADETARAEKIAADLLAQAEHDVDARPILVTTHEPLVDQVEQALVTQIEKLPTAATARESIERNGMAVCCESIEEAIEACNLIAPEHLELMCEPSDQAVAKIKHAGCLFYGPFSAEVFGDYGIGPNHTLPTAGTARYSAGLNVFNFIRIRSWIELTDQPTEELLNDVSLLAELEGLAGHKAANEIRRG